MGRIKILFLFLGGAVVLCIVLFVVLLVTLEDDHYRWLVTRTAEQLTGYKVVIEGPFSLDLSIQPSLSASKIRLEPGPGGSQPPVTHIGQIKIKFAVRPLQSGTIFIRDLFVDDVTISVITGGDLQTESPPEIDIPIIESVTLQNIDVNITNKDIGRTMQIRLQRLNIDDIGDTGPMYVKADGAVNTFDFRINGKLGSLADILDPVRPYPIELNLNVADLDLTVSGTVDDPVHGKGIALSFSGSSTNRNIIRIFLPDDLPDFSELKLEGNLCELQGDYALENVKVYAADDHGFAIKADGGLRLGEPVNAPQVKEMDMRFHLSSPTTEALKPFLGDWLREMGPVSVSGRVLGSEDKYQYDELDARASDAQGLVVEVSGSVDIVKEATGEPPAEIDLEVCITAPNMGAAEPLIGARYLSDLGPVRAKGHITGTTEVLSLENIVVRAGESSSVNVEWRGRVGNIPLSSDQFVSDVEIFGSIHAKDASVLASLAGISVPHLGPLAIKGRLKGNRNEVTFEGETHLAHSQFTIAAEYSFDTRRPRIVANISTPAINLADLGIYSDLSPRDSAQETSPESSPSDKLLFDETPLPLDMLKAVDLSISLDAEKVMGKNFVLQNLDLDLLLQDARLHISSAKLKHAEGYVTIDFMIDSAGSKPQISLKATAEDVDMDAVLAHVHRPLVVGGELNLVVDLHSAGRSAREIASALTGEFGFAIENGRIKRGLELLGADAISLLSTLPTVKKYQDLNCLAIRLIFEDGIGNSQIIFIDTPNVRARGMGSVNLISETMDLVIQPKPKKGLPGLSSAMRIQGPLADPQVRKLPFREAARLSGEIFMPYVFLPARGLGYLWYLMKNDKDEQSPCLLTVPEN